MDYYEEKFIYLVKHYGELCPIGLEKGRTVNGIWKEVHEPVTELHHLLHNTKVNQKLYPLFIDSLLNLRPVSNIFHLKWPSWGVITPWQAQKIEKFLFFHPAICEFVNSVK